MTPALGAVVQCTLLAVEGATGVCNSLGRTDMRGTISLLLWFIDLTRIDTGGYLLGCMLVRLNTDENRRRTDARTDQYCALRVDMQRAVR